MAELSTLPATTTPVDLVAQGHAIIRIENETMQQVAVQRPRDEAGVIKGALQELDLVPEEAAKAYYSIPYKERQPDGSTKTVKVEGPSVKAAMALARRWGNCTTGARVLQEDGEGFDVEGFFIDLETNFRITRPQRVSKWFKPRSGGQQLLSVDRQLMAVQSGASKAIRNACLAALPAYLVAAYDKKARAIAGGKLDAPAEAKTVDAVIKAFERWKITREQLEAHVELPVAMWTGTQVADLRGLWNALNDGQTTVEEIWPAATATSATNGRGAAAVVTPETLLAGAHVHAEDRPDDPRLALLAAIDAERAQLAKPMPDATWAKLCKGVCGTDVLETVDPAALDELCALLRAVNAKDPAAIKRVGAMVA